MWLLPAFSSQQSLYEMEPRIQCLEYKLAAVNNLAGKLLAVEELAAEMGVAIPELEVSAGWAMGCGCKLTASVESGQNMFFAHTCECDSPEPER